MKAALFDSHEGIQPQLRLAGDYPDPQPPAGEVRIRTILAGICNTDLEVVRGYAGFSGVLGHEFVGIVDQCQDDSLLGRRVVGEINAACGQCGTCRAGRPTHCPQRSALGIRGRDGTLAEYFCLPAENLHLVPEGMPDQVAVFTEPLAAACQILEQVHIRPTDRVIVLGDGKLGLLVAQAIALTGCHLLAVGRHADKLAILAARGIPSQIGGEGLDGSADIAVECTGSAEGFHRARQLVRNQGTLVLKSTYHDQVQTDLSSWVVDEIRLVGSRCGPFAPALRLLDRDWVDVASLVQAEYPLEEVGVAFAHAARPGTLKVLVRP